MPWCLRYPESPFTSFFSGGYFGQGEREIPPSPKHQNPLTVPVFTLHHHHQHHRHPSPPGFILAHGINPSSPRPQRGFLQIPALAGRRARPQCQLTLHPSRRPARSSRGTCHGRRPRAAREVLGHVPSAGGQNPGEGSEDTGHAFGRVRSYATRSAGAIQESPPPAHPTDRPTPSTLRGTMHDCSCEVERHGRPARNTPERRYRYPRRGRNHASEGTNNHAGDPDIIYSRVCLEPHRHPAMTCISPLCCSIGLPATGHQSSFSCSFSSPGSALAPPLAIKSPWSRPT
jgi:hypothetical protein